MRGLALALVDGELTAGPNPADKWEDLSATFLNYRETPVELRWEGRGDGEKPSNKKEHSWTLKTGCGGPLLCTPRGAGSRAGWAHHKAGQNDEDLSWARVHRYCTEAAGAMRALGDA